MGKSNEELQKLRSEVISAGVSSVTPVHVASARGAVVRDVEGREYIDFGGGIGQRGRPLDYHLTADIPAAACRACHEKLD